MEQAVYWSPEINTGIAVLTNAPKALGGALKPPGLRIVQSVDAPDGHYAMHVGAGLAIPIILLAGTDADRPLAALITLDDDSLSRIETLVRFWRATQGRSIPSDTRITPQRRRRMRLMLRAIDGRAEDASYRDIAVALYGARRVAADPWKTSSLRDSVIGLVESARAMIAGGYRQLLRHRRR